MKSRILLLIAFTFILKAKAQETIITSGEDRRVITTGVPFLLIASDARAASMGDMGVATSVDAYSQQWNPSKYAFAENKMGFGFSYTPYLSSLVKDIFLGNVSYYNRLDERSAFGIGFKYFSLGEIEFVEDATSTPFIQKPYELAFDASYALRLSDKFAMSVAMRYLRSDLRLVVSGVDASSANTFGVDLSGYYQGEEKAYTGFNGKWRGGFAIQNIGPKFKYDDGGTENFQPTTLRLGGGFDFILDNYNKVAITAEFTKMLVPTPPVYGYVDTDGDDFQDLDEPTIIVDGKDPDVEFLQGMFQSFGDSPGGFNEEIKEFTWALGAEYLYNESFAFRLGYFNESEEKGARKFFALGAGFKANVVKIDLSYLFSASKIQSPLENTLRFSLTINLGSGTFEEL